MKSEGGLELPSLLLFRDIYNMRQCHIFCDLRLLIKSVVSIGKGAGFVDVSRSFVRLPP